MKIKTLGIITATCLFSASSALAGPDAFMQGQAIPGFGKVAEVKVDQPVYKHHKFKVAFDVSKQADAGALNRNMVSAARFINMHTAAGVKEKNIKITVVLHGSAATDVTSAAFYKAAQVKKAKDKTIETKENANAALVKTLIAHGVEFYVCGQTAAYYDIKNEDLLPGVKMALSAMTTHALLQQKGYTLNPF